MDAENVPPWGAPHMADWVPIAWRPAPEYSGLRWRCRVCGEITDDEDVALGW